MTWINFLSYLGMGYALYYVALYLFDSRASPGKPSDISSVLTFSENVVPEKVSLDDFSDVPTSAPSSPASIALGGVSIKDLFDLARKDAIEFTKSVSF